MISARDISWGPSCLPVLLPDRQQRTAQHGQPRALCSAGCVLFNVNAMQFHVTILCSSSCNGPRSATKKHGFQNIKGVFSHCSGAFSVENDCVHSRTACECRKFSSVATLKVLFFLMVPCFFALQVVFVFVPLARFWDFRKCFHAHKWAGACFSLYDIGQTGATSRPLPECAPRSGRDTRTPCPRWKPHSAPRRERSCTDQQHHTPAQHRQENAQHRTHAHDQTAPAGSTDTRSTHPYGPDQTPSRPRWKLCSTRSPTRSGPQTARKPARLSSRTGFFFCMMEPDTARRTRSERTTRPDRRPRCPLHPHSAGEIIHRSGRESTTSTTTAPRPVRATPNSGPHWKPTADPAGSSSNHAHDQTAHAPAGRPVHTAPVLVMGKPPADTAQHAQRPHPDRPQISQPEPPRPRRRASEARHSIRHTARHFFKSKAQIRHILAILHPL